MVGRACISSDAAGRRWPPHALFCLFAAMIACPASLAANEPTGTRIVAPSSLKVEAPGQINFDIRIVAPRGVVPSFSIVIRGLPVSVKLSAGEAIGSNTWKVPVLELADLKMTLMAGAVGKSDLELTLVTSRDVVLARASSELIVERPAVSEALPARGAAEIAEKSSQDPLSRHAAAEEARKTEEAEELARAEQARKSAEARKLEEGRKAAEAEQARKAEEVTRLAEAKAEEAIKAEEAEKVAATQRAEQATKADEARKLAEAEAEVRKAEEGERLKRAEQARKSAEARKLEEARKAAEAEQARKAEEVTRLAEAEAEEARKAEEAEKLAAAQRMEQVRKAAEVRKLAEARAEEARKAQEAEKLAAAQRMEQARKAEEARKLAEAKAEKAKKAEEARKFAEVKAEERRKAQEAEKLAAAQRVEQERKAEGARKLAEAKAEEAKKAEAARKFAEVRAEEARKLAEAKAEEARKAEAQAQQISSSPLTAGSGVAVAALPEQRHDPEPTVVGPTHAASTAQRPQSERLFTLGERYRAEGNIVVARQYFLRAAHMGLASAAFKLAETYDPYELERLNAQGPNADLAEAKGWYARAAELGAEDANARLVRLGAK